MSLLRPSSKSVTPSLLHAVTEGEATSEVYRQIYVGLALPADVQPMVIGVTSAISGEGRTTVALGLARTLASDLDVPVALVEIDLDRPALARQFDIASTPGLAEVLRGEYRLDEVLRPVSENLSVVTAGAVGPDVGRLLRQVPVLDPFHGPDGPQGIVILDLPPIMNHSYAASAAAVADAVVLVVRAGVTPYDVVREAIARCEDHPPQGVVLNGSRSALPAWWPGSTF